MQKEEREKLKELARNTIANELGLESEKFNEDDFAEPVYLEERGVFVTLEINGHLRGCIGNIEPVYPLYEAVKNNARQAAFGDPRFSPLTQDEFEDVDIEISVLTVPKKLEYDSPEDLLEKLRPGTDGVVLQMGMYKSTYLPQVWDDVKNKEEFMSSLAMKAGLDPEVWKDKDCEIFIYEVEKF